MRAASAELMPDRLGAMSDTTTSAPAISPATSPDGRTLAYIARQGNAFRLYTQELSGGAPQLLSDTSDDENPSFSANSRMLVYGTKYQGRESLMTTTVDGRVKTRLITAPGEVREPHWGPLLR